MKEDPSPYMPNNQCDIASTAVLNAASRQNWTEKVRYNHESTMILGLAEDYFIYGVHVSY